MQSNYKYYIKRQDNAPKIECSCGCGEMIPSISRRGYPMKLKNGHTRKGESSNNWKGGRHVKDDYQFIRDIENIHADNNGYVPEHVKVFTEYNKCCMLKWGVVHHKDENRKNNNIDNLQGMTRANHMTIHKSLDMSNRTCVKCGTNTTYIRKDTGRPKWKRNPIDDGWYCCKCFMKYYDSTIRKR